jgi:hypothetical protein
LAKVQHCALSSAQTETAMRTELELAQGDRATRLAKGSDATQREELHDFPIR